MTGKLFGVGVGPGDPELITLKAVRVIGNCSVVVLPTESKEHCYAYRIVQKVLPEVEDKEILCCRFPMTKDPGVRREAHEKIYRQLQERLEQGKDIAFLTIGDPSIYSTYQDVHERAIRDGYQSEMISGVPSFCAVAAVLGIALGDGGEEIHIYPDTTDLEESLSREGTKIFMKSGRQLGELREKLLRQKETYPRVYGVANCGMENQKIMRGAEEIDPESGYLTMVIVR